MGSSRILSVPDGREAIHEPDSGARQNPETQSEFDSGLEGKSESELESDRALDDSPSQLAQPQELPDTPLSPLTSHFPISKRSAYKSNNPFAKILDQQRPSSQIYLPSNQDL